MSEGTSGVGKSSFASQHSVQIMPENKTQAATAKHTNSCVIKLIKSNPPKVTTTSKFTSNVTVDPSVINTLHIVPPGSIAHNIIDVFGGIWMQRTQIDRDS